MSIEVLRQVKVRANLDPDFRGQLLKSPLKFLQDFDLTEDEKRQVILPNFSWLVEHKLAAMSYPESEDAFTLLWRIGIRALINLTEEPLPGEIIRKVGILTEHIPIVDFTAPNLKQVEQAIMSDQLLHGAKYACGSSLPSWVWSYGHNSCLLPCWRGKICRRSHNSYTAVETWLD